MTEEAFEGEVLKKDSVLEKLLNVNIEMAPIQMFSLRFDQYPASFFLFELLSRSSVTV
jgi:hypothetical protein